MKTRFQQGLLSVLIISLTACGGGGGGSKNTTTTSSLGTSSVTASDAASSSQQTSSALSSQATTQSSLPASSSASSNASTVSTTYKVSVSAPLINETASLLENLGQLLIARAHASRPLALTSENFAVVIVDLEGNVVERISVDEHDITYREDGTYLINVPGDPRLDCLIITNLSAPVVLPEVANINSLADVLFAPATTDDVDIDLGSTAGYINFLDQLLQSTDGGATAFADLNLDVHNPDDLALVESIINNVQTVINNQVVVGYDSIAEAVAALQTSVVDVVKQEALNIAHPAPPQTNVANSIQQGGIYWYEGAELDYIVYGEIAGTAAEKLYRYHSGTFESYDYNYLGNFILSDGAWVHSTDTVAAYTFNEDGSATLVDPATLDNAYRLQHTLSFNLAGRKIADYFYANFNTRALANLLDPNATFSEGALGLRLNVTSLNDHYSLWYEPADEQGNCIWHEQSPSTYGDNCHTAATWSVNGLGRYELTRGYTQINQLLSTNTAPGTANIKYVDINFLNNNQNIAVQLINDEAKTAKYYLFTWWDGQEQAVLPVGEGTWSYFNLPGMEGDAAQAIRIDLPAQTLENGEFDEDDKIFIMALHNGYVRLGNIEPSGTLVETEFTVLNGVANNNIQTAIQYTSPLIGTWQFEGDQFIFSDNTNFTHIKIATDDENCQPGSATGYYTWNQFTHALHVDLTTDTTAILDNDSCSIGGTTQVTVDGDQLHLITHDADVTMVRIE